MAQKPAFVHKVIVSYGNNSQSKQVTDEVNKLIEDGYFVKVISHDPLINHGEVEYTTTINATRNYKVDIGLLPPTK